MADGIRLNKYLSEAGVCSRRAADTHIENGKVTINGETAVMGQKVMPGDVVTFMGRKVQQKDRTVILAYNKPIGLTCTASKADPDNIFDHIDYPIRLQYVGRLDKDSQGLLLLTNDGDLASKLTHPKYLKKKIYHVHLDKNLTKADMEQIAAGIQLDDGEIQADAISYTDDFKKDQVGIEIHSGKNRIVRRIFESLGYKVVKLDRVFFAGLTKKGLRRGDWRYLSEAEVNYLRMGSFE